MNTVKLEVKQEVNESGQLTSEEYSLNDKYHHNEHGPAIREWNESGVLVREEYWLNGNLHNEHGAAYRRWDDSGVLVREEYWLNDKYHNEHGPAYRRWDDSGVLKCEEYWLNGKELTKEEWQRKINPDSCLGKVVTVDGRQYRLGAV